MDNIIIVTDSESDSDYSDSHSDHDEREEVVYENTHFMNHVETEESNKNRNQLFGPPNFTFNHSLLLYVAYILYYLAISINKSINISYFIKKLLLAENYIYYWILLYFMEYSY